MSKKIKYQIIQPDPGGPRFGQSIRTVDLAKAQSFAHSHVESVVRDFIRGGCTHDLIAGFDLQLIGGMTLRINAPGHIVGPDGKSYELIGAVPFDFTLSAGDAFPRIDLIVATIESDSDAVDEFMPFIQLRTQAELEAGVDPYPPTQFNQPTEIHTRATLSVKEGPVDADTSPAAPTLDANEIALWSIFVLPDATAITAQDVTDIRVRIDSLCELNGRVDQLENDLRNRKPADHEHFAREIIIGAGAGVWEGKRVQEFINAFAFGEQDSVDPLIMPEVFSATGKIDAAGAVAGGIPVIDFPVNQKVVFADKIVTLEVESFPSSLNPRPVNKSVAAGTEARDKEQPLSLAVLSSLTTDGGGDFILKTAKAPAKRLSPGAAARDGRFIECFGGAGQTASGLLSDWFTYDTLDNQVIVRALTGTAPPASDRPFLAPCGDGKILVSTPASNGQTPRWFLVNPATSVSTEKAGGPGAGYSFFTGDLIQPGIIVFLGVKTLEQTVVVWKYDVAAGTFAQLATVGPMPNCPFERCDACLYTTGNLVVLDSNGPDSNAGVNTYIFNYATLTWSRLNIPQPFNPFAGPATTIAQFRMRNINGRPLLVGGSQENALQTSAWELTPGTNPSWRHFNVSLPRRWQVGLASTLQGGLPRGLGVVIAGRWPGNIVPGTDEIFIYGAAGVVETQLNGVTGITLGPNTTQAVFRIPDFGLPWQVARYLLSLQGNIPPGTVKLRVSLDGGVTFQSVTRDQATTIAASSIPGSRVLEVTLLSAGSAVPILTKTIEHFEQTGGSSGLTEVVIRVDCPASQKWWMLGRDGLVTVATQVSTNTTSKALLIRTNHIGTVAPAIRRFISRRDATISFRGVKAGGVDPAFLHELAVVPNHVTARGIDAAGKFYDIPEPAFSLDSNLIVSGLAANGDKYEVEVRVGYSYIVQFFSI